MNSCSNELGQVDLVTTTTTVKEKYEFMGMGDTIHHCMVKGTLLGIQGGQASVYKCLLLLPIICSLFIDELVSLLVTPIALWYRHAWIVLQALAMSSKGLTYEMQSIIMDLILSRLRNMEGMNEMVL